MKILFSLAIAGMVSAVSMAVIMNGLAQVIPLLSVH